LKENKLPTLRNQDCRKEERSASKTTRGPRLQAVEKASLGGKREGKGNLGNNIRVAGMKTQNAPESEGGIRRLQAGIKSRQERQWGRRV